MKYRNLIALPLCAMLLVAGGVQAAEAKHGAEADKKSETPIPEEKTVKTHHSVEIDGDTIDYTATVGNVLIRGDDGKPTASVFYVAYTKDGVDNSSKRPVTFLYNGGPGSSSVWLHMGSIGPRRIVTANAKPTAPAPYDLVPNHYSMLNKTDLVFIDAIGTGYSKAVGEAKNKDFWGVDEDVKGFAKAISRYVTINQRWNSPKFLFGESYGTTRSSALVNYLQGQGMAFNGVVLVSSILDYGEEFPGNDLGYELYLPSYSAIAYDHDKLPNKPKDFDAFLKTVRQFSLGEYAAALSKGDELSDAERDAVAQKLHQYTGLDVGYLKDAKLRVDPSRFRKELLRDEGKTVGRYDARFEGIDYDNAGEYPGYDASDTAITDAFVSAFNQYVTADLKYHNDVPYKLFAGKAIQTWDWKHRPPGGGWKVPLPYVVRDLSRAMRENPHLKVFSANGYYDLATPFFKTEYDLKHMMLPKKLQDHVTFGYYPSGHMIYLNVEALKSLKKDLDKFYDSATHS